MKNKKFIIIAICFMVVAVLVHNSPGMKRHRAYIEHLHGIQNYLVSQGVDNNIRSSDLYADENTRSYKMLSSKNGYSKTVAAFNKYSNCEYGNILKDMNIYLIDYPSFNTPLEQKLVIKYNKALQSFVPYAVEGLFGIEYLLQSFDDIFDIPGIEYLENAKICIGCYGIDDYREFNSFALPYLKRCTGLKRLEIYEANANLEFLTETTGLEELVLTDCYICGNCEKKRLAFIKKN